MTPALLHLGATMAVLALRPPPLSGATVAPKPPDFADRFTDLVSWVLWGCTMVCVVGIAIIGARLAVSIRRGETGEHAARLGAAAAGVIIVGLSSTIVNALIK